MHTKKHSVAVGVFTDHAQADRAVNELKRVGFSNDQIGVAGRDWRHTETADSDKPSLMGEGALAGALTGAGLGGLVGLGVLSGLIPVIGPAIAAGTLGVILTNAAGGAAIAGIVGALAGLGMSEEDAKYYESEVKSGRFIVTVRAEDRYDEAKNILQRFGAYDRVSGPTQGHEKCATASVSGGQKMELKEEELHAHKQPVQTGEVRIRKEVTTEHKTIDVPVKREEVVIERHPVAGQPSARSSFDAGEIRIPVTEEQVHVEKRPVVVEEVSISKQQVQETEKVSGTVRKEKARVERTGEVDVHEKRR